MDSPSPYFSLDELVPDPGARRFAFTNWGKNIAQPLVLPLTSSHRANLAALSEHILLPMRSAFRSRFRILRTWCPLDLQNYGHAQGSAADVEVLGVSNLDVAEWVRDNLEFELLVLECCTRDEPEFGWLHIEWSARPRRRFLWEGDREF